MNFGKNPQHDFPKMRGGSTAVWNFSENSSGLGGLSFSKKRSQLNTPGNLEHQDSVLSLISTGGCHHAKDTRQRCVFLRQNTILYAICKMDLNNFGAKSKDTHPLQGRFELAMKPCPPQARLSWSIAQADSLVTTTWIKLAWVELFELSCVSA